MAIVKTTRTTKGRMRSTERKPGHTNREPSRSGDKELLRILQCTQPELDKLLTHTHTTKKEFMDTPLWSTKRLLENLDTGVNARILDILGVLPLCFRACFHYCDNAPAGRDTSDGTTTPRELAYAFYNKAAANIFIDEIKKHEEVHGADIGMCWFRMHAFCNYVAEKRI
jgi:hypothetical protein